MRELSGKTIRPKCKFYRECGGCQLQYLSYEDQLILKENQVNKLMGDICQVEEIIGTDNPFNYRNKAHYTFGRGYKNEIISGMYARNSHKIINIDECIIQNEKSDQIVQTIKFMMKSFKMEAYDEDRRTGFLRHVLIKNGVMTGEYLVVLVVADKVFPGKKNFVKALTNKHPEITSIVMNINNKKTSLILGDYETTIYGKGFIEDILFGKRFRISSKSFYQINPSQTEKLYRAAIDMADIGKDDRVIDAYSGIGTISIIAADYAREVIGVELNKDSVRNAVANAKANNVENVNFINQDAGDYMVTLAGKNENIDLVIMDPPREGSNESFLSSVVKLSPRKLVYISCNPETQNRDIRYLMKHGYEVKKIQPVDMFMQTDHVETIALLGRVD